MRRTPDFLRNVDFPDDDIFYRPDSLIGDYLENHRILKALHERLHFPELEGIIDDAEALNSFYVFDGARFIKDRVIDLFDDSEYGFLTMLAHLGSVALQNFNFPVDEPSYRRTLELRRDFLLSYKDSFEFDYFFELVSFTNREGVSYNTENRILVEYRSDWVSADLPTAMRSVLQNLLYVYGEWSLYAGSDDLYKITRRRFWHFSRTRRLLRRSVARIDKNMESLSGLSKQFYVIPYVLKLSACLNLPDDKYAEPGEKVLIDNWLDSFDKFYREYEKLKAWYVNEKENSDSVTAQAMVV